MRGNAAWRAASVSPAAVRAWRLGCGAEAYSRNPQVVSGERAPLIPETVLTVTINGDK